MYLYINVFDEVTNTRGGDTYGYRGGSDGHRGDVITTSERRFLGSLSISWHSRIEGKFKLHGPKCLVGYEMPKTPPQARGGQTEVHSFTSLIATIDPFISPPEREDIAILPGKEHKSILTHAARWESAVSTDNIRARAFGTDLEGFSVLICRCNIKRK
eukprot:GHVR01035528.1.p1 GENE.GHVR01035528.1~~GHVR01035528.1.p1  ORF type:complete len:158 (-),score=47.60 GHVR01035528.1:343-816(-)